MTRWYLFLCWYFRFIPYRAYACFLTWSWENDQGCFVHMLSFKMRTTLVVRRSTNIGKQSESMKKAVNEVINTFLRETEHRSTECCSKLDYSWEECQGLMSRFYVVTGTQEIFEASKRDSIDNFLPIVGGFANAIWGNTDSAKVSETFMRHLIWINFVFRRGHDACWNDGSQKNVKSQIVNLKSIAPKGISKHHSFGPLTETLHACNHLSEVWSKWKVSNTFTIVCASHNTN